MNFQELEELKRELGIEESFLKTITRSLLNSKIKKETISPLILTHKEFIDISLKRIVKKIQQELLKIAKRKNMPIFDKIFEAKLNYLAAYLVQKDIKTKKIIHKTIAEYILNLIKRNPSSLNNFFSTVHTSTLKTAKTQFVYPEIYPYDRNRYSSPLSVLTQEINQINTTKKILNKMEEEYKLLYNKLQAKKQLLVDIKLATIRIKTSILPTLKAKENFNEKKFIFDMQQKRFEVLEFEAEKEIKELEVKVNSLKKSIQNFIEKNKEILEKEKEIINTLANNLSKTKQVI